MAEPADEVLPAMTPLSQLRPAPWNPRRIDQERLLNLQQSMAADPGFLWRQPVLAMANGDIYSGNMRYRAAVALGWTEIPAVVEDVSLELAKERALKANGAWGEWDDPLLAGMITELQAAGTNIGLLGFPQRELQRLIDSVSSAVPAEEQVPEPPINPRSRPGDIWLLGKHRVMCGDSTKVEDVNRLMGEERAVLFATDPPYGVDYDGMNHPQEWGQDGKNKDWSGTYREWDRIDVDALYTGFIDVAVQHAISPRAAWYCWHASRHQAKVEAIWEKAGAFVHEQIIWVKDRPVLTRSWYMWQHEPCLFGWIRKRKPRNVPRTHPRSVWIIPAGSTAGEGATKLLDLPVDGTHDGLGWTIAVGVRPEEAIEVAALASPTVGTTVWALPTIAPGTTTQHPTSKPVRLFEIPMEQHTVAGDVCYEPFSGSGSQLIAAERLGRRCYAMELQPVYVDVTVERWCQYSGLDATREADGASWAALNA